MVIELPELVQAEKLVLDVRRAHEEEAPVGRCDDLARALLLFHHRVEEVEEAALGQVIGGEFLYDAAAQQSEVAAIVRRPASDAFGRRFRPSMLGRSAALADVCEVDLTSSDRIRNAPDSYAGNSQFCRKSRTRNSSRVMCQSSRRLPLVEVCSLPSPE